MDYGQWTNYTYEDEGGRYDVYESYPEVEYKDERRGANSKPALNLQADEGTLRCLKWILVDQKGVELEVGVIYPFIATQLITYYLYRTNPLQNWRTLSTPQVTRTSGMPYPMAKTKRRPNLLPQDDSRSTPPASGNGVMHSSPTTSNTAVTSQSTSRN